MSDSNTGTIDLAGYVSDLRERVLELERKVLVLGDEPPGDEGCCTVLCCDSAPGTSLTTGQSSLQCARTLEETAGVATRIVVIGFVTVTASAGGNMVWDLAATVDSQAYLFRPRFNRTVVTNDQSTLTVVNTIDTNATAPVVSLKIRNLSTVTFSITYVNMAALVYGVRDGSTACGESAGTS